MRHVFRLIFPLLLLTLIPAVRSNAQPGKHANETAGTGPRIILIIRHAEKPDDAKATKDEHLSKRGFERAAALAEVIVKHFPKPDFLIATKKSAHSNRPVETIAPLSKALHEVVDASLKDEEFAELAHKLLTDPKYSGKVVLIAWHHGKIPELTHALGASEAPAKWENNVFDRVWEVDIAGGKATWKSLPQKALPGDSQD